MMALLFSDSVGITDKYIWFFSHDGIFARVNKSNGKCDMLSSDDNGIIDFSNVVDNILNIDNILYAVNQVGSKLLQYDVKSNSFNVISIPVVFNVINWGSFSLFERLGNNICLLARDLSIALLYDVKNKSFFRDLKLEEMLKREGLIEPGKQNYDIFVYYNILYFVGKNTGRILLWDWQKKILVDSFFCNEENEWFSSCVDEDYILLLSANGVVYIVSKLAHKVINAVDLGTQKEYSHKYIIAGKDKYFILPSMGNDILTVEKNGSNLVHRIDVPDDLRQSYCPPVAWSKFHGVTRYKNEVWAANRMYNYYVCVDVTQDEVKWLKIKDIKSKDILDYLVPSKKTIHEQFISLNDFIEYDNNLSENIKNTKIGKMIFDKCVDDA